MKFYVASKFENQTMVGEIIDKLELRGHTNTYDWRGPEQLTVEAAVKDIDGVCTADFLVGIFIENLNYKGAIIEVGMAIALDIPIFILGDWLDSMIFMKLPIITKIKSIDEIPDVIF